MTAPTNALGSMLVKGIRGITAADRPSHVRIESADGKQIAFLVGKKLHVPSSMSVPATDSLPVSSGRRVLVVTDESLARAREILLAVHKAYLGRG